MVGEPNEEVINLKDILNIKEIENKKARTEKIKCDCGGSYISMHKSRHFASKEHTRYIELLNKTKQ